MPNTILRTVLPRRSRPRSRRRYALPERATSPSGGRFAIFEPTGYIGERSVSLLLCCHGAGENESGPFDTNPWSRAVVQRAQDAGYLCASALAEPLWPGASWGNEQGIREYLDLLAHVTARYDVSRTVLWGASMGGLNALLLAERLPQAAGLVLMYPVCSLAAMYADAAPGGAAANAGNYNSLRAAHGIPARNYEVATAGHDPLLMLPSAFRERRILMFHSRDDRAVLKAHHSDPFRARFADTAAELTLIETAGDHADASNWDWPAVSSFLQRCV